MTCLCITRARPTLLPPLNYLLHVCFVFVIFICFGHVWARLIYSIMKKKTRKKSKNLSVAFSKESSQFSAFLFVVRYNVTSKYLE